MFVRADAMRREHVDVQTSAETVAPPEKAQRRGAMSWQSA